MWPRFSIVAAVLSMDSLEPETAALRPKVAVDAFGPDLKKICKRIASVRSLFDLIVLGNGHVVR